MSERTSYAPGTPCWVDLATPDLEAAESFYGALFGWEIPELPNSAEMGGYRRAKKNGKDVAGAMPLMQEGQPPAWSTYVSVDDADAIAARDPGERRHDDRRADGRDGLIRPAGGLHRPRGRRLRDLAAGRLRRRRAGQRARRLLLERARDPRPRRGEGVLRPRLRLGVRRGRASGRDGLQRRSTSARTASPAWPTSPAGCPTRSRPTG